MTHKCEYLFCKQNAIGRLTVPRLKPRFYICKEHLGKILRWAEPYRKTAGRVAVEHLPPEAEGGVMTHCQLLESGKLLVCKAEKENKQLLALLREITEYTMPAPIMKRIRAAIAKAEGKTS